VYVKIHHPSDVVAGALLGLVLARVARRVWPFP
jgi:membrane-associated phospholipid phosphatase